MEVDVRDDIRYVVVERPRVGGKYARNRNSKFDWANKEKEPPPNNEAMRKRYGYNSKSSTDFLNPLIGFLHKNVGRPWNKVYSEICENLRMDSVTQRHVRSHVYDTVNKDVQIREDGAICLAAHRTYFYELSMVPLRKGDLYICPRTGLLKKVRRSYK